MRPTLLALVTTAVLTWSIPAEAGEDDRLLSAFVGVGAYTHGEHAPQGATVGAEYERGFSDAMSLRASVLGGYYFIGGGNPDMPDPENSFSVQSTVGVTYFIDVLKYVPYANLGVGAVYIGGGPAGGTFDALVEFGVGLDVLHSRSWSYGVQIRMDSFAQETSVFSGGVRGTYRWGFF